jgi:nucleotide-binding universal stress UspA family protein
MDAIRRLSVRRRTLHRRARRALAARHKTFVVPLLRFEETRHALDIACNLAVERGARVLLLAPLYVDAELPLDAHFPDDERTLREELARERAIAERYGVNVSGRIIRARRGALGRAVAAAVQDRHATLVVVGAPLEQRRGFRHVFDGDVLSILRESPARVMVAAGAPHAGAAAGAHAAA